MLKSLYFLIVLFLLSPILLFAVSKNLDRDVDKLKVRAKLAAMVAEDQGLRFGSGDLAKLGYRFDEILKHHALMKATQEVDHANTKQLKAFVKHWGWISISQFGEVASDNAWLLIQHADHDIDFQDKMLKLMTSALKDKDVKASNVAYLWDRVQVNRGLPQRYGTQGLCKGKGRWEPRPLEDTSKLDEYRKSFELSSFSEYLKQVTEVCQ